MRFTRSRALSPRAIVAPMAVLLMAALFLFAGLALAAPGPDQDRFIVKFQEGKGPQGKVALRRAGAELLVELAPQNAAAFRIPAQALAGIARNPNVEYIEVDPPRYPMAQVVPYGITMVQAEFGVNGGIAAGGFVPKVCIIDSGIDGGHEDLPVAPSGDPSDFDSDTCGHGSHVAGTIAAVTNQTGVVGVMGDASSVELIILKVFDGPSCGYSYASSVASAANKCADLGADIINMSLGCTGRRCSSRTEQAVFDSLYGQNVLSIAAAGNDGNTQYSYPASYSSVVSVAAVDENQALATFSQRNDQVELAGPGVGVLSTVPTGMGLVATVSANTTGYAAAGMDGSPSGTVTNRSFVDCGLGTSQCDGATDAICLISRGTVSFSDKVLACQAGGGRAAVIYNNEPGMLYGTLGGVDTSIPSVGISDVDGLAILDALSAGVVKGSVELGAGNYDTYNGTSMATPHVAGVAALVWSHVPDAGAPGIREALQATAIDLGSAGRDNSFGYGLVQAAEAVAYLGGGSGGGGGGGGGGGNTAPTASFSFSCTALACDFDGRGSSDSGGTISSYDWTFGDGNSGSGATPSHTYGAAGTYNVTLTVTDDAGATAEASQDVTVTAPSTGGIVLSANGYKVKGTQTVDLTWSGATSGSVDIKRDNEIVATGGNSGSVTDDIGAKGGGSYTYQVCETGTITCSALVNVTF